MEKLLFDKREVSELSKKSSYPDKADTLFWDNFIVEIYRNRKD